MGSIFSQYAPADDAMVVTYRIVHLFYRECLYGFYARDTGRYEVI
jgi:hypothetical protein